MGNLINSYTRVGFIANARTLIRRRLQLVEGDLDEYMLRETGHGFPAYINSLANDPRVIWLCVRSKNNFTPIYIPLDSMDKNTEPFTNNMYLLPKSSPQNIVLRNCYNAVYAPYERLSSTFLHGVRAFVERRRSWRQVLRDWPEIMYCAMPHTRSQTTKPSRGLQDLTDNEKLFIQTYTPILAECMLLPDVDDRLTYFR